MSVPRKAATIVVLKQEEDHEYSLYMTKRPESMAFMGGFYVFPGGAVDADDYSVSWFPLLYGGQRALTPALPLWIAAVRELFEETGILLAKDGDGQWVDGGAFVSSRRLLNEGKQSFLDFMIHQRLYLDLSCLKYFGRRITPSLSPIRFDTSFFLAVMPNDQKPAPFENEVTEGIWIRPSEALERRKDGTFRLAPPTVAALKALSAAVGIEGVMGTDCLMSSQYDNRREAN